MVSRRHLGADLVRLARYLGRADQVKLGECVAGRVLRSGKKGGQDVAIGGKGKGSTIHLITESRAGIPLAFVVTSAAVHETRVACAVVDAIHVQPRSRKFPRRPKYLIADRGYDSMPLRNAIRQRGIQPIIPARKWKDTKPKPGRPRGSYQPNRYQGRWKIERTHAWMDNFRRVAVRWDHSTAAFKAWTTLSCIMICLNNILR
jgi:transposase